MTIWELLTFGATLHNMQNVMRNRVVGPTGATGATGPDGDAGLIGSTGLFGDTGATGPHGQDFAAGNPGSVGTYHVVSLNYRINSFRWTCTFAFTVFILHASLNIDRFWNLFHCQNQRNICNNTLTKDRTTPKVYRYTTMWNVNVFKATIENKTTSVTTRFKSVYQQQGRHI